MELLEFLYLILYVDRNGEMNDFDRWVDVQLNRGMKKKSRRFYYKYGWYSGGGTRSTAL